VSDHVRVRLNPNFKADVIKAAEEKLGVKIATEKDALQALQKGQRLSNAVLGLLSRKGLIEVQDVNQYGHPARRPGPTVHGNYYRTRQTRA